MLLFQLLMPKKSPERYIPGFHLKWLYRFPFFYVSGAFPAIGTADIAGRLGIAA